ncbi:hypothetical protein [Peptostreptococcus canis]|uniref:YtxH domain-containing protein n=1 Tax=Peptostreptococcus canis TaxID=1159213 RepID=A0ABR6TK02_9FIRM|nr:hypothetical protein [Peptostreptococcus canis]MBC2575743.1 hypothetical protein [Peptostreptococcus canis]MBP1998142.1 hypothetical protein [Peptostreptococcus canis]
MKKFITGALLGTVAGAIGYKVYKNNEEEIKDFLKHHLDFDEEEIMVEDMEIEELEELRDMVDDLIINKAIEQDIDLHDDYLDERDGFDNEFEEDSYDELNTKKRDEYIILENDSK